MDFVSHLDIGDDAKAMLIAAAVESMVNSSPKPWTQPELDILHKCYPFGGATGCRDNIPHRTVGAIYEKAKRLGLKAGPSRNHLLRYSNSPHIDEAIRRFYLNPKAGGISKLALQVHRPRKWVSTRARYLGVTVPRIHEGPWSEEELALLRKHASKVPFNITRILAKHGFRRSTSAVKNKLLKLRCDRDDDDMYTACGLADLFGVDVHLVSRWIKNGWLAAQMRGTDRVNDIYQIHHKAVRRFVIENASAIDIRRCDKFWLIDLLAGRE